eukprot:138407-Amorphochlora_amoeboformis.AAC.1
MGYASDVYDHSDVTVRQCSLGTPQIVSSAFDVKGRLLPSFSAEQTWWQSIVIHLAMSAISDMKLSRMLQICTAITGIDQKGQIPAFIRFLAAKRRAEPGASFISLMMEFVFDHMRDEGLMAELISTMALDHPG